MAIMVALEVEKVKRIFDHKGLGRVIKRFSCAYSMVRLIRRWREER